MQQFLTSILSYPTVVPTVLLGIAICYWLLVIVGALGIDALGGGEGEGAAEGAADGHGDLDGHVDGHDGHVVGVLKLKGAPLTVVISICIFFTWVLSLIGTATLGGLLGPLGALGGGTILLLASVVVAYLMTTIAVRPLAPFFRVHHGKSRRALVGKTCVIVTTGEVNEQFGQARLDDAGTEYTLRVRADAGSGLHKGDEAIVIDYDDERDAYVVEAVERVIGKKRRAGK
jgi:hypothetical protein